MSEDDNREPRRGEIWRHIRFNHCVRVEAFSTADQQQLVRFHTLKSEQDRKARRYSTERRVQVDDFWRMYRYDADDQSSDDELGVNK